MKRTFYIELTQNEIDTILSWVKQITYRGAKNLIVGRHYKIKGTEITVRCSQSCPYILRKLEDEN